MPDILARLKEAINGKAPQHKVEGQDDFELTEGQGGKLNVRDTDAHTRLDAIEQTLNGTINTQLTGSNVIDTITHQRSGVLAAGSSETLVDILNVECELQSFSLGADYNAIQIRISFYKEDGTLDGNLKIANSRGTSLPHPSPLIVQNESNGENDFWAIRVYDDTNNQYVLTMKRPLKALNGLKITVHNFDSVDHNVAINAAIATWKRGA